VIHRKQTLEKLRAEKAKYIAGDPVTDSVVLDASLFENAMELAEAQDQHITILGTTIRTLRKQVRDLHKVIDKKADDLRKLGVKLEQTKEESNFFSNMAAERAIQRDDAVEVVKNLNDLLVSLNKFKSNQPRSLMTLREKVEFHKNKE
jgi:chromosome segregation ATPase